MLSGKRVGYSLKQICQNGGRCPNVSITDLQTDLLDLLKDVENFIEFSKTHHNGFRADTRAKLEFAVKDFLEKMKK